MTPEKTNFITQGYDGVKRLRAGPFLDSYRGLNIIHSRQYSLETGAPPRDLLRRRVRVAEYYRIPWSEDFLGQELVIQHNQNMGNNAMNNHNVALRANANNGMFGNHILIDLYDESKDTFFTITWQELLLHAALDEEDRCAMLDSLNGHQIEDRHNIDIVAEAQEAWPHQGNRPNNLVRTNTFVVSTLLPNNVNPNMQSMLMLQTTPVPLEYRSDPEQRELITFYRNSGLFAVPEAYRLILPWNNAAPQCLDMQTSMGGNIPNPPLWCVPQAQRIAVDADLRKAFFTQLMMGYPELRALANDRWTWYNHITDFGMRPNLHVGRMVYSFVKPQAPRFVHVAAQIFSQIVVTKKLTNCLLQVIHKPNVERRRNNFNANWTAADNELFEEAIKTIGIDPGRLGDNDNSYFGIERSLLVYMAACVLHPNQGKVYLLCISC
jgi:hypothetical protein